MSGDDLTSLAASSAPLRRVPTPRSPSTPTRSRTCRPPALRCPRRSSPPGSTPAGLRAAGLCAAGLCAARLCAAGLCAAGLRAQVVTPDLESNEHRDAFSAAQSQSLLAISTAPARSGVRVGLDRQHPGFFYVRVQGHDDQAFVTDRLSSPSVSGPRHPRTAPIPPTSRPIPPVAGPTRRRSSSPTPAAAWLRAAQSRPGDHRHAHRARHLAAHTKGSSSTSPTSSGCALRTRPTATPLPLRVNLWPRRQGVVDPTATVEPVRRDRRWRRRRARSSATPTPPVWARRASSSRRCQRHAAGASLDNDQVHSQDAYGSNTTVTIGGATVPWPISPSVGWSRPRRRSVGQVDHFLVPDQRHAAPARLQPRHRLRLPRRRRRCSQRRVPRRAAQANDGSEATPEPRVDTLISHAGETPWSCGARRCWAATTTWSTSRVTSAPTTPWPLTS